ncbi:NAD+ synthase [Dehalococcoidia bacterium]|nr:NAD+ synthase [Dehalococcoidia bacterium]MCL0065031.1 NAD+ synthase [Dehalococcoidia bacterium]
MSSFRIGLAQVNCTVGDLEGNTAKILHYIDRARAMQVDLLCFPEMAITGYPPEDLLLKPEFISGNLEKLDVIVRHSAAIALVVGFVDSRDGLYNAAAVASDGELCGIYHKTCLPNYGVFDEKRYFQPGTKAPIFVINGVSIGVNICEDIWYPTGPASRQASAGAEVIVNISASPYHAGKRDFREQMLSHRASEDTVILAYVNLVGGQDELVFDGGSMLLDERGEAIARAKQFEEDFVVVDLDIVSQEVHTRVWSLESGVPLPDSRLFPARSAEIHDRVGEIYAALVLGTRDYIHKNGFYRVLVGLSGGVDSSLVAAIAVDALGPENVVGVSMPSRYSSEGSRTDARLLSENLGIEMRVIPIEEAMDGYLSILAGSFAGTQEDIAEENLQARIRGNILMALSNKFGWLVLTTGNKSEIACGYCTLYGDTAGGFAVIKDVPKTLVYELARHKNSSAAREIIPRRVIEKEPSAELRPGQRDVDSLPPYEVLDPILEAYIEEDKSLDQIVALGFDRKMVQRVISLVDRSEFKRRQSPPGIKITPRAFGKDRRFPITNRYRSS